MLSGVITGLSTSGLVLQNGSEELLIPAGATTFRFSASITVGTSYSVFVKTQPIGKTCSVANGAGNMPSTGVSGVQVTCSSNAFAVGGTVTNLVGAGLKLRNGADVLVVPAGSTAFTMPLPVAFGGSYSITVEAQPVGQICSAANSSGTMGAGSVTSVQITCASNMYTLGGSISGLKVDGLVLNNGSESLSVPAGSSSFVFRNPIAYGGAYAVTISRQPNRYTCSLENSSGTMGDANAASIDVTCSAYQYRLVDLGILSGCYYSRATALSSDGKVAGNSCAQDSEGVYRSRAFLYANGRMQDLGVIGADAASESRATGVNSAGIVVGTSAGDTGGFIWNGTMERFPAGVPAGTFPGLTAVTEIYPEAINDDVVVVGSVVGLQPEPVWPDSRAFVHQSGVLRYLGDTADGATMFIAHSISRDGHVVARGDFMDPTPSPYLPYVALFDLGSSAPGAVVGGFMHACSPSVSNAGALLVCIGRDPPIATELIESSVRTMIPPLDPDGSTFGSGINRWGEVVGSAYRPSLAVHEGFIYREGEALPLDDVLDSSADGWHIVGAADINDDGLIAATAKYKAGEDRAVLLVPIR
jgi:probable HAF family extracellular repeat protein